MPGQQFVCRALGHRALDRAAVAAAELPVGALALVVDGLNEGDGPLAQLAGEQRAGGGGHCLSSQVAMASRTPSLMVMPLVAVATLSRRCSVSGRGTFSPTSRSGAGTSLVFVAMR